jgi:hypothetical protein
MSTTILHIDGYIATSQTKPGEPASLLSCQIVLNQRFCRHAGALVGNSGMPGCSSERCSAAATR